MSVLPAGLARVAALLLAAVWSTALLAQTPSGAGGQAPTTGPSPRRFLIDSLAGPDLFRAYCASCHGEDGRGRGPAAGSFKTAPADLTGLSRRAGGAFPQARVLSILNGDGKIPAIEAHGTSAMPVWGPIFRALEAGPSADVRVANLVRYLEGLQQR